DAGGVRKLAAQISRQRLGPIKELAVTDAHFSAMPADRGQSQRRKQTIKIADTSAAHQCDRTARQFVHPRKRTEQGIGNLHFVRRRADVDNRTVDVEEQGDLFQIQAGKNIHNGVVSNYLHNYNSVQYKKVRWAARSERARPSTSPSTRVTPLNSRSKTFPSLRAIARYSPSAKITRGNAPIDSLITSPPGVSTDHAVLASASPPRSLTNFSVMTAPRWVRVMSVGFPACTRMSERTTELASP